MHTMNLIRNWEEDDTAYIMNLYCDVIFTYFPLSGSELNDLNMDAWQIVFKSLL